ncbi:MAG TPA: class I SAM-dependent methyltransferase [Candidatus Bathyarchaeota archaeon]|nr:class I SAM-dependent methyltransferase [Candidatus Bathyarchaeota archaeon]
MLGASKRLSLDENLRGRIREANVAVHRFEAKYYELIHPEIYNKHEQKRLNSALKMVDKLVADKHVHAKKALDFGAGTGNLTCKLLQMGYEVTAIDLSAEMCKILENKFRTYLDAKKLVVINSPIEDVGFDRDEFDLITCYSVLHHLPDYMDVIQRLCGFLKKGGVMYLDHEASPFYWKSEESNLAQLMKLVYFHSNPLLNALYFRILGVNVPSFDYGLSDYWHNKEHHLDHEKIKCVFENERFDFFKRTDYHLKFRTWILNPIFYLYKYSCKPEMSFWVAKR